MDKNRKTVLVRYKKGPNGENVGDVYPACPEPEKKPNKPKPKPKKPKKSKPKKPKPKSGCAGPDDPGGGRVGSPTSPADIDKSKAGGSLVTDPAAGQWPSGLSGVDTSNHPNQASNPGYDGGRGGIDGGVKHDPQKVVNPPQKSGN